MEKLNKLETRITVLEKFQKHNHKRIDSQSRRLRSLEKFTYSILAIGAFVYLASTVLPSIVQAVSSERVEGALGIEPKTARLKVESSTN